MIQRPRPLMLLILDGWGYREESNANAIAQAKKPNWDNLWQHYTHTLISGSGKCVGLPEGQMGNSEVGHLNMGAGRVVHQDLTRIDLAIKNGDFFSNPVLTQAIQHTVETKKALHILGLLSSGGVHSHEEHIIALVELAAKLKASPVYLHIFLDGRDTPPKSAEASINHLVKSCEKLSCGKIVSIIGRYYAMDRDKRWERIQQAYDLLTLGKGEYHASTPLQGLHLAYERGETDEFVKATSIHEANTTSATIKEGDTVIFMNFRADRAREITQAFIQHDFNGFIRTQWPAVNFITLTEYDATFNIPIAFPSLSLNQIFGEYISNLGLRQLQIAETEKYAHVTFFFNGGIEQPYPLEDRILIPSPKVSTYDLQPEMSALEVTEQLVAAIESKTYDVIICNFANPDMVGHTGNLPATILAIETIDKCLGKIISTLKSVGGEAIITADHGNAELMFNEKTQQPHTAHTHELVPFIYVGRNATIINSNATLSDIAPTLLYLMDFPKPSEMTGQALLQLI
ncbi:MAG: 2,3-bisphosphoglycerate-independent phosphoglycerate mutase [Gammaproteobacteria bacterium]|nr:2,3-bisphosphoglycerate-independent phosphoglycerate mutase [Gammaproteobacteria bacterium]